MLNSHFGIGRWSTVNIWSVLEHHLILVSIYLLLIFFISDHLNFVDFTLPFKLEPAELTKSVLLQCSRWFCTKGFWFCVESYVCSDVWLPECWLCSGQISYMHCNVFVFLFWSSDIVLSFSQTLNLYLCVYAILFQFSFWCYGLSII